ncbi:hypothetical protein ACFRAE_05980 [Sphingobacterium sp. HJSM2_6]|uniref:hypothetical protein n=1 Tax=Sphingobacterium sp. HJSM2_6 TaxID=3366264 RepID=UPI003BE304A5
MNRIFILFSCILTITFSCTKEKTNYEAERSKEIPSETTFSTLFKSNLEGYEIEILSIQAKLQQGYNEIRVKIKSNQTHQPIQADAVHMLPVLTQAANRFKSAPHSKELTFNSTDKSHDGYVVFTQLSTDDQFWELLLQIRVGQQIIPLKQRIKVDAQSNKNLNLVQFTGIDQEDYTIALIAPRAPNVAENRLIAGIYKRDKDQEISNADVSSLLISTYNRVQSYRLQLDPRMPEPSMGNHSSPNNRDLEQQENGWYEGVVNYTMTGNWTLNFILLNSAGRIIKGTPVPKDFTPGVAGIKSELFIDILF